MSRRSGLTTTSYGILGLLAIKPWTTYELAKQMDRSLGRIWPRARSKLFEEPKRLVAGGFARASKESRGRRPRTVYRITPKGRRALAEWLKTPGNGPVLEFEQLMQVFFCENGSKEDVLRTLRAIRTWAEEQRSESNAVGRTYLEGEGLFPERAAILALTGPFLADFYEMVGNWAEWASGVAEKWPRDLRSAKPDWKAVEEIVARDAGRSRAARSARTGRRS